jgi:hypothetical protein
VTAIAVNVIPPPRVWVRITPGISCEAVPASELAGAGMRRHVHSGNHAAESFVSFIPLFGGTVASPLMPSSLWHPSRASTSTLSATPQRRKPTPAYRLEVGPWLDARTTTPPLSFRLVRRPE